MEEEETRTSRHPHSCDGLEDPCDDLLTMALLDGEELSGLGTREEVGEEEEERRWGGEEEVEGGELEGCEGGIGGGRGRESTWRGGGRRREQRAALMERSQWKRLDESDEEGGVGQLRLSEGKSLRWRCSRGGVLVTSDADKARCRWR